MFVYVSWRDCSCGWVNQLANNQLLKLRLIVILLPIHEFLPRINESLALGRNLVLQAEPGVGKSTALPLSLLDASWLAGKKILMLEPRRVAAKSIAHFLAQQLQEKVGGRIGYQIKNDRKISKDSVLEVVTEGILTRRLQNDSEMSDIGLIIFDEFHERSIHADLSLMLALEIQQTIRDDLKLLVMSATIDTNLIAQYMDDAEVISCPGRSFPVSVEYIGAKSRVPKVNVNNKYLLANQVMSALSSVVAGDSVGDVLVFLPGQADINKCLAEAKQQFGDVTELVLLPLYGGLSLAQQEQALVPDPHGKRRIIFTTNIAETSLTIAGVTCVVDSGLEKVMRYDPSSGMTRLETTYISKASAEQRQGRAGRTQTGTCIRLWDEQKHRSLRDYQGEEILSADLTGLVLDLCLWGAGDYETINWLTPPPQSHFNSAQVTLESLGLIDSQHKVTALGERASAVGLSPRLAAMLLQADGDIEQGIAVELASLLADRDIFHQRKGVDIGDRLLALQDYKMNRNAALQSHPLKHAAVEQLLISAASFKKALNIKQSKKFYSVAQLQNTIGKLLLYAYPDRLAQQRAHNSGRYQLANGRGVFLFDDDPLFNSQWLVVAEADAQKKEGRIFSANAIDYESMSDSLSQKFVHEELFQFDKVKQKITGTKVTKYQAIKIASVIIPTIPNDKFQYCLSQILQEGAFDLLNWTPRCDDWVARAQWLGLQLDDFPEVSISILQANIAEWLLPYLVGVDSIAALKKVNVLELLRASLPWSDQQILASEAPIEYKAPSNKTVAIVYDEQQGPTVSIQLQEMFGEVSSPIIGGGKVPIRFELLSPARRPIQTTSDLANFWQTSYFAVAKDMRGRYPRHRWPDEPLLEKAGKSIKSKKGA